MKKQNQSTKTHPINKGKDKLEKDIHNIPQEDYIANI